MEVNRSNDKLRKGLLSRRFNLDASVFPAYTGGSLLNLPASIFTWFHLDPLPHPPLQMEGISHLAQDINQIIIVLIDAVAYDRAQTWMQQLPEWQSVLKRGVFTSLTSVTPCTTCNVLTTLWTGCSPAQHAVLGYELFLKEYGLVANMITHSPMAFGRGAGALYQAGFDPESALPVSSIGPALSNGHVETHTFLHYGIAHSGLSRMHYQSVERHSFGTPAELWIDVRQLAEQPRDRRLIWVYHGAVDNLSHRFGPDSEQARVEFLTYLRSMYTCFLAPLSKAGKEQTLLILTADHGQVHTPPEDRFDLRHHPELLGMLHIKPTGENRFIYFHPRPNKLEAVEDYIHHAWPGEFITLPSSEALQLELFGPGAPDPAVEDRIGELIAFPTGNGYLWWADKPNPLLGRHGAFDPLEMRVPFMAMRLD